MDIDRAQLIEKHIRAVLNEEFGVDEHMIMPQSRLREDLGLDNVEALEFIDDLMGTFTFDLPSDQCEAIRTVQEAIDAVVKNTGYDLE